MAFGWVTSYLSRQCPPPLRFSKRWQIFLTGQINWLWYLAHLLLKPIRTCLPSRPEKGRSFKCVCVFFFKSGLWCDVTLSKAKRGGHPWRARRAFNEALSNYQSHLLLTSALMWGWQTGHRLFKSLFKLWFITGTRQHENACQDDCRCLCSFAVVLVLISDFREGRSE